MELKKFLIKNYKSIKYSGDCYLASDITVIAGKNEAGKTAILEALKDFNFGVDEITEEAIPFSENGDTEIILTFSIKEKEIEDIFNETGLKLKKAAKDDILKNGINITKNADGFYYMALKTEDIEEEKDIEEENIALLRNEVEEIPLKLTGIPNIEIPLIDWNKGESEIKKKVNEILKNLKGVYQGYVEGPEKNQVQTLISNLNEGLNRLRESRNKIWNAIRDRIPNFILFSDFNDILPFELPFSEAISKQIIQDFARISGLDLKELTETTDPQRRRILLSNCSARITGDFKSFYSQDELTLTAESEGENLRIWVIEKDNPIFYKPSQRSKGFQWFLSFYLRLLAEGTENDIVLIDEPGLYLHAKAQEDVLSVLEN